jgi:hypothetical protein
MNETTQLPDEQLTAIRTGITAGDGDGTGMLGGGGTTGAGGYGLGSGNAAGGGMAGSGN